jgi:hypothetical protein
MSTTDRSASSARHQSPLSEAIEQATAAVSMWCREVAEFAQHEADVLSTGDYGLNQLATAQVRLLRIWVTNSIRTAVMLSDNFALLSYGQAGRPPPPRRIGVRVPIPAGVSVKLRASDLIGELLQHRIASSRVKIDPDTAASQQTAREIPVEVTVDCANAPNDTYIGDLFSVDGLIRVPIEVAIDELGEPLL